MHKFLLAIFLDILRVTVSPELCNRAIASERGFPLRDSPLIASSWSPTCSAPVCSARPPEINKYTFTFLLTIWPYKLPIASFDSLLKHINFKEISMCLSAFQRKNLSSATSIIVDPFLILKVFHALQQFNLSLWRVFGYTFHACFYFWPIDVIITCS